MTSHQENRRTTTMNAARPAPQLPPPPHPVAAARAVTEAAQETAKACARMLPPAAHGRAVSQIHSALRDIGIASYGLAGYQATDNPPNTAVSEFQRHTACGSRWLFSAHECLDSVLAAEGIPPSGDPDDPGAALCQAARRVILAWRHPQGSTADRDETVRQLIIATGFLSAAITALAAYAPRQLTLDLQTAGNHLAEATSALSAAAQPLDDPAHPQAAPDER
jgi:hypothetical protein